MPCSSLPGLATPGQPPAAACAAIPRRSSACRTSHALPGRSPGRTSKQRGCSPRALRLQVFQQPADAFIDRPYAREIIVQVALVFPADQVLALRLGVPKRLVERLIIGVPGLARSGVSSRRRQLQVSGLIVFAMVMSCVFSALPRPE